MGRGQSSKATGIILLAGTILAGSCLGAENYNRARYNVIVDRAPFGADPALAEQDNAPTSPEVQRMEREMRLCFLLQSPESGEIRAGFQNLKASKGEPKSVVLAVGESFQAMKLVSINYDEASATMEYRGKSIVFDLTKAPNKNAAAKNQPASTQPRRRFGGGFRRTTPPAQPATPPEPELSPEEQQQRMAEIRQKLQEQQMDIIRKGQPPLPIPLTKEMDDQLVKEGVLPPADEEQEPAQQ